jgi:hypothetical protein
MTHPITVPPELVQQWLNEVDEGNIFGEHLANRAARWGADQELKACCAWLDIPKNRSGDRGDGWLMPGRLRRARRPAPNLKEQARDALGRFFSNAHTHASQMTQDFDLLRRAVEQLP